MTTRTTRLFVFATAKAAKPIMVLECDKVSKSQATINAAVNIESVKPGMVCHPGVARKVDHAITYVVKSTDPKKTGFSTIHFVEDKGPASVPLAPEPPKP